LLILKIKLLMQRKSGFDQFFFGHECQKKVLFERTGLFSTKSTLAGG